MKCASVTYSWFAEMHNENIFSGACADLNTELGIQAKQVSQNMLSAEVNILNLDITVDYFIFHYFLLSKEVNPSILHVDASSHAVAGCRSQVCVLCLEQDK